MTLTTVLTSLRARLDRPGQRPAPGQLMAVHVTPYISAQGGYLHDLPDGRVVVMAGGRPVAGRRPAAAL